MLRIGMLLSGFFNGKEINIGIHPDDVAYGATVYAAICEGDTSERIRNLLLLDVAALSLSIETSGEMQIADASCPEPGLVSWPPSSGVAPLSPLRTRKYSLPALTITLVSSSNVQG
jgi:molecular chaperone DnaK (HSP70)